MVDIHNYDFDPSNTKMWEHQEEKFIMAYVNECYESKPVYDDTDI